MAIVALNQTLNHGSFVSGYFLFTAVVFLALFNFRQKVDYPARVGNGKTVDAATHFMSA